MSEDVEEELNRADMLQDDRYDEEQADLDQDEDNGIFWNDYF